jgi:DNA-binding transcriptional LysR family regulator
MDKLTGMRVFTQIATMRSFKKAGERLGMAPSVISKYLSALEAELGVQLVERTTRTARVTEMGELYLSKCRPILDEIDDIETTLVKETGRLKGPLTISAPPGFTHRHIAPHLPAFSSIHPDVNLNLMSANNDSGQLLPQIDLDIRISETRVHEGHGIQILAGNRRQLVGSPNYLSRSGSPKLVSDLAAHKLVTVENGLDSIEWHFKDAKENISTFKARGYLRLDSGDAILRCILNDGGLAMLPTYIVGRHISSGALLPVLETLVDERTPIHAVWRQKNHRLPKIEAFLTFLQQLYGDTPYWDAVTEENKKAAMRAAK